MGRFHTSVVVDQTLSLPLRSNVDPRPTPVTLDLTPRDDATRSARLDLYFTVRPMEFSDGTRVSRYTMAYKQAHFSLVLDDGCLSIADVDGPQFQFEKNTGEEREKGAEIKPVLEVKAGSEGAGVGAEFVTFSRKTKTTNGRKITGDDDSPLLGQLVREDAGHAYWTITRSPIADAKAELRVSHRASAQCRWRGKLTGSVALYARGRIMCDADGTLSTAEDMLVKLAYWVRGLQCVNSIEPHYFEIVGTTA